MALYQKFKKKYKEIKRKQPKKAQKGRKCFPEKKLRKYSYLNDREKCFEIRLSSMSMGVTKTDTPLNIILFSFNISVIIKELKTFEKIYINIVNPVLRYS